MQRLLLEPQPGEHGSVPDRQNKHLTLQGCGTAGPASTQPRSLRYKLACGRATLPVLEARPSYACNAGLLLQSTARHFSPLGGYASLCFVGGGIADAFGGGVGIIRIVGGEMSKTDSGNVGSSGSADGTGGWGNGGRCAVEICSEAREACWSSRMPHAAETRLHSKIFISTCATSSSEGLDAHPSPHTHNRWPEATSQSWAARLTLLRAESTRETFKSEYYACQTWASLFSWQSHEPKQVLDQPDEHARKKRMPVLRPTDTSDSETEY